MKMRLILGLSVALALTLGVSTASAGGGNSANAQACQQGGWQHLTRADGTSFTNQGDCVSYAAQGGTLVGAGQAQGFCQSIGGTFSTDPSTDITGASAIKSVIWTCNGVDLGISPALGTPAYIAANDCFADGGTIFVWRPVVAPFGATCGTT
jgi:hypothetical protein